MLQVNFPQQASFENIANMFNYALANGKDREDHFNIDYSRWEHCPAGGVLLASAFMRQFANQSRTWYPDREVYIEHSQYENCSYQGHIGYFHSIGVDFGIPVGEARRNENLLPITKHDFQIDTTNDSPMAKDRLSEEIRQQSLKLAEMLTRSDSGDLFNTVNYSLREIFRNVVEHSGQGTCWYCAQYWPTKPRVEIAILDEGTGIYQSMINTGKLPIENEEQAMKLAISPGYSRHGFNPHSYDNTTGIGNSGFGLFMLSKLFGSFPGDVFEIYSGNYIARIRNGRLPRLISGPRFEGTAIMISANTNNFTEVQNRLDTFTKAAEEETKIQITRGASASARLKF